MADRRKSDAKQLSIPFLGGAYEARSKKVNAQKSINIFPVRNSKEAKVVIAMYGTPGYTLFDLPGEVGAVRGLHVMGEYLYAVINDVVYEITTGAVATSLGTLTTSSGYVGMDDNGTQLLIVDGTAFGHIVTTGTLTDIVAAGFPAASDCIFFDGYFLATVVDTGKFQISGLYDGLLWDALDVATAEAVPDNLVGIRGTTINPWFFGTDSIEVYYNAGMADFPFLRVPGAVIPIGCIAAASITEINGILYWLTNEKTVARSDGYSYRNVSTPDIDYQISTYATISDAIGWTYTLEGRSFYVLTFPTADKTWVLDTTSAENDWHEWQSDGARHRGVVSPGKLFNKLMIIGDKSNGSLYALDMDAYDENGTAIARTRRTQTINRKRVFVMHRRLEIEFEPGVGLDVSAEADGYDPQATLRWSDDETQSWSTARSVSIGKYQEYNTRAVWRELGKSRNRIYELTITEQVKVVLIGTHANLTPCRV